MLGYFILNALLKVIVTLRQKTQSSSVPFNNKQFIKVPLTNAPFNAIHCALQQQNLKMNRLEPITYFGSHLHETNSHQCNTKRRTTRRYGQWAKALRSRYRSSLS